MILRNGLVLIDKTLKRLDVRIDGKQITQLEEIIEPIQGEQVYDFSDKVITPAFVNTHTHTPMAILKGVAEDLPLTIGSSRQSSHSRNDSRAMLRTMGLWSQ